MERIDSMLRQPFIRHRLLVIGHVFLAFYVLFVLNVTSDYFRESKYLNELVDWKSATNITIEKQLVYRCIGSLFGIKFAFALLYFSYWQKNFRLILSISTVGYAYFIFIFSCLPSGHFWLVIQATGSILESFLHCGVWAYVWNRFSKHTVLILPLIDAGVYAGRLFNELLLKDAENWIAFSFLVVIAIPLYTLIIIEATEIFIKRKQAATNEQCTVTYDLSTIGISSPFVTNDSDALTTDAGDHVESGPDHQTHQDLASSTANSDTFSPLAVIIFTLFLFNNSALGLANEAINLVRTPTDFYWSTLIPITNAINSVLLAITPFMITVFLGFQRFSLLYSFVCIFLSIVVCSNAIYDQFVDHIELQWMYTLDHIVYTPNMLITYYLIAFLQFVKTKPLSLYQVMALPAFVIYSTNILILIYFRTNEPLVGSKDLYLYLSTVQIVLVTATTFLFVVHRSK